MKLVLLSSLLLPAVLSTAFGSNSAVITSNNVWENTTDSKMSLTPGEKYRVYAVHLTRQVTVDYASKVFIKGTEDALISVVHLAKPKADTEYILDESNILTAPITITDTNAKPGSSSSEYISFVIYFVSVRIPVAPVLNAELAATNWQTQDHLMHSSRAKISSTSCTVLSAGRNFELGEIDTSSLTSVEVKVAGFDALADKYTVMTVTNQTAKDSLVVIEGPIATLYNPQNKRANYSFYVIHNQGWYGTLKPGASTAFLSQGWLSVDEAYDSAYGQDITLFTRNYGFGTSGKEMKVTFAPVIGNYYPPGDSCRFDCATSNGMSSPHDCGAQAGTVQVDCCASFTLSVNYKGSKTGPRFMVQIETEDMGAVKCRDWLKNTTTTTVRP